MKTKPRRANRKDLYERKAEWYFWNKVYEEDTYDPMAGWEYRYEQTPEGHR